jgi:hypothetical protein
MRNIIIISFQYIDSVNALLAAGGDSALPTIMEMRRMPAAMPAAIDDASREHREDGNH